MASYVQKIENINRIEHLDAAGGGSITRVIYVEPYSSYPYVVTCLKGTIVNGGGVWSRIKPHTDPIKPWFYCSSVTTEPFAPEAVRGSVNTVFIPNSQVGMSNPPAGQQLEIMNALDNVESFDFDSNTELTPAEIAVGKPDYPADTAYNSKGTYTPGVAYSSPAYTSKGMCGAILTINYSPLIFLDGLSSTQDVFDFVDPVMKPETILNQTGLDLSVIANPHDQADNGLQAGTSPVWNCGGLTSTHAIPEVIWNFSIRRLFVPFLPQVTINTFTNKINGWDQSLGNLNFPKGTLRLCEVETDKKMTADGLQYWDLKYNFKVRTLWDGYYRFNDVDGKPDGYVQGWIDWNHHWAIPTKFKVPINGNSSGTYYPIAWNDGVFQLLGANRPEFLRDIDVAGGFINEVLFNTGFRTGQ